MGRVIEPSLEEVENLRRLCLTVLQPLRDDVRRTISILSGLRPLWLNAAVPNASKKSRHIVGCAADVIVQGMTPFAVCARIRELALPVDQVIHEFPPNGWSHVGIAPRGMAPRLEYLTARRSVEGSTRYETGIHA